MLASDGYEPVGKLFMSTMMSKAYITKVVAHYTFLNMHYESISFLLPFPDNSFSYKYLQIGIHVNRRT